uniref:transmembrane protein 272-like n=1 Tax=Pristiophorus japonicus TaxID=55135 RepID=UPI00398F80AE
MATLREVEGFFVVIFSLVDFTYLLIAVRFLHSCPKGHLIPIYNIVSGLLNISIMSLEFFGASYAESCMKNWLMLCKIIEGAWLAAGFYWTYQIYPPDYTSESSPQYCHKGFYTFAIVSVTISCVVYITIVCMEVYLKFCVELPPEEEEKTTLQPDVGPETLPAPEEEQEEEEEEEAQSSTLSVSSSHRRSMLRRSLMKLQLKSKVL